MTTLDVCYTLKLVCVSDTRRITSRGLCSGSNKSTDGYSAVWLRPGLHQFEVGGSEVVRVVLEHLGNRSDHEFTIRFNLVGLDMCVVSYQIVSQRAPLKQRYIVITYVISTEWNNPSGRIKKDFPRA